jgi:hypothetical protein
MRLIRFSLAVALTISAAATSEARKPKPTPAPVMLPTIWQTWEFPGYGEVRADLLAENGHVTGRITNSTTLKITLAGITFRTYRQPLSGLVTGTVYVQPTAIPAGQAALLGPFFDMYLEKGCALVFDSISIDFELQNGGRKTLRLNADANPPPLWYALGPACAAQKQAYEAAKPPSGAAKPEPSVQPSQPRADQARSAGPCTVPQVCSLPPASAPLTAPIAGPIEQVGNGVSQPGVIFKVDPVLHRGGQSRRGQWNSHAVGGRGCRRRCAQHAGCEVAK